MNRSAVEPVDDRIIHLSVELPLAADVAFGYFVDPELVQRWLVPKAVINAEVGGRYELFWDPDDRENDSTIGCRITAMVADQLLAFQWRSPRQFKSFANVADPLTHVVVTFHSRGTTTTVNLVHSGWRSAPEWEEARAWNERAWSTALAQLARQAGKQA